MASLILSFLCVLYLIFYYIVVSRYFDIISRTCKILLRAPHRSIRPSSLLLPKKHSSRIIFSRYESNISLSTLLERRSGKKREKEREENCCDRIFLSSRLPLVSRRRGKEGEVKKGAQARRSEQNARRRRGKREDGIAAGNERTNGRATLARAASARVDEMVRGEQSIRHHAFLLSARAQCVLYIPRAAVLLLLDRAKAENAPSFLLLLLLRRPFRYLRYSDTDNDVPRAFPSPSIATTRYNAISRVKSEKRTSLRLMLLFF